MHAPVGGATAAVRGCWSLVRAGVKALHDLVLRLVVVTGALPVVPSKWVLNQEVELISAHSGLSGSKYDKKVPKPLSGIAVLFGEAAKFAVERSAIGGGTTAKSAAPAKPATAAAVNVALQLLQSTGACGMRRSRVPLFSRRM